jgi:hypothetical protein
MPHYKILQGSFRDHDGSIKVEGDTIELSESFAAERPHEVELVDVTEIPASSTDSD